MVKAKNGEQVFTNCTTGGPVKAYVKDGRIIRVEPLELSSEDGGSWTIKARGKTYSPPNITRVSPYTLAERSRIYGPNRLLYPMKRVDFKTKGDRKAENRGVSGYKAISWEEALDIMESEIKRIQSSYGPGAILTTTSSHHNWGNIGYRFSAHARFMAILGAMSAEHNPDSWEGWHWGAMHNWGYAWRLGLPEQYDLLEDALKNTEMMIFWSADPEATAGIYSGQESTLRRFWLKELGIKMVFIDPYFNHTAGLFADKWITNMVAGRGFIALAAVIFGRWDPLGVVLASLLFGYADTFRIIFESKIPIPGQFVQMFPYVLAVVVLAGLVGRSRAPAWDGRNYEKGED